jgi:hypothetical protein
MTSTLLVKVSRDGKEIGTYEAKEAVRLLVSGTLKETDFYWHEGMTDWAPLVKLQASEARKQLAERALQQKQEEARRAEQLAQEKSEKQEQAEREKAKAKEEEERAVAEAVRLKLEARKANFYRCHSCRESFPEPLGATELGSVAVQVIGVILSILAFVVGGTNAHLLGIVGLAMYWGPEIRGRLPSVCPNCRSANFSRPEKVEEKK